jgi:hypothetical protein
MENIQGMVRTSVLGMPPSTGIVDVAGPQFPNGLSVHSLNAGSSYHSFTRPGLAREDGPGFVLGNGSLPETGIEVEGAEVEG